jgi:hypothetical protein
VTEISTHHHRPRLEHQQESCYCHSILSEVCETGCWLVSYLMTIYPLQRLFNVE